MCYLQQKFLVNTLVSEIYSKQKKQPSAYDRRLFLIRLDVARVVGHVIV